MAEYIEREALERSLSERLGRLLAMYGRHDSFVQGFEDCIGKVEEFPAADVAPVVHGRWVRTKDGDWECTNCKETVVICVCGKDVTAKKTICPNCGARMDGERC